jgi:hypothetical protein
MDMSGYIDSVAAYVRSTKEWLSPEKTTTRWCSW